MTPHTIGQEPADGNSVLIDHERRIGSMEKKFDILSMQVQTSISSVEELKTIVVQGNKDSMEFFKEIIGHEHGMEKSRNEFKQHMQQVELDIKQKQIEAEEKLKNERQAWEQKQKEQSKEMFAAIMRRTFLVIGPIVTTIVALINFYLNNLMGGPPA